MPESLVLEELSQKQKEVQELIGLRLLELNAAMDPVQGFPGGEYGLASQETREYFVGQAIHRLSSAQQLLVAILES